MGNAQNEAGKTDSIAVNGLVGDGKNFTPGPWEVRGQFIGPRLSLDGGIQLKVARVAGLDAEADANARLIAEAPALLAHLEWAAKFLQPLIGGSAQYDAIRATIASARGDTNARAALGEPQ
ncbi:MAG: hypothetical protein KG075_17115 [Alphaproteobacteria bacterium]|nr:hypothetical protein [Alphaproteobacteria bacterium]